jgi:hypothetical protein
MSKGLLSGEHFSVDGTLIKAWASHKSMRRKDGSDDGRPPEDWRGERRSNETHESKSDPESRLYRKSNAAPALPSYLGHVVTDNRHGLVVNVQATQASMMVSHRVEGHPGSAWSRRSASYHKHDGDRPWHWRSVAGATGRTHRFGHKRTVKAAPKSECSSRPHRPASWIKINTLGSALRR